MSILIMCSNAECGELLDVPEEAVGKKVRCLGCGTVQVAAQNSSPKPAAPATPEGPEKSPEKPASAVDPDGDTIDLTQFNEWVPDTVPASPKKPSRKPARENAPDDSVVDLTVFGPPPEKDVPSEPKKTPPKPAPHNAPAGSIARRPSLASLPVRATSRLVESPAATGGGDQGWSPPIPATIEPPGHASIPADARTGADGMTLGPLDDPPAIQEAAIETNGDGVLESQAALCAIFLMGVAGIVGGAAAGFYIFRGHPITGVYVGGALGWVAGFMVASLFVLSAERANERVRCPDCGKYFPEGTGFCNSCGAELAGPSVNPIARGGLHAGSYGLGSKPAMACMALLGFIGGGIAEGIHQAAGRGAFPDRWLWMPVGLLALVLACLSGYLLEFLLSAVRQTLRTDSKPPLLPLLLSGRNLLSAVGGFAVACMYVVPLVTLPLLPPALLYLSASGMGKALNPKLAMGIAWRRSGDFIVLWLVVFLWVGGLLLSLALAVAAFIGMDRLPSLVGAINPAWANPAGTALWILLTAVKSAIVSTIVCIFGLAIARCIGLFGRRNR